MLIKNITKETNNFNTSLDVKKKHNHKYLKIISLIIVICIAICLFISKDTIIVSYKVIQCLNNGNVSEANSFYQNYDDKINDLTRYLIIESYNKNVEKDLKSAMYDFSSAIALSKNLNDSYFNLVGEYYVLGQNLNLDKNNQAFDFVSKMSDLRLGFKNNLFNLIYIASPYKDEISNNLSSILSNFAIKNYSSVKRELDNMNENIESCESYMYKSYPEYYKGASSNYNLLGITKEYFYNLSDMYTSAIKYNYQAFDDANNEAQTTNNTMQEILNNTSEFLSDLEILANMR